MIHVLATIQAAPGRRADLLREFHALLPQVRAEKGCIEYGPAVDVPTKIPAQPAPRPDVLVMVERWQDLHALEAHLAAQHMADFRAKTKELVAQIQIQVLEPA
ncbi:MAG TPA: putative quinol monooxygenase [Pirellulales bacterium]|nr:putative quinol monooxygenase [Pirellulales bacterium]